MDAYTRAAWLFVIGGAGWLTGLVWLAYEGLVMGR